MSNQHCQQLLLRTENDDSNNNTSNSKSNIVQPSNINSSDTNNCRSPLSTTSSLSRLRETFRRTEQLSTQITSIVSNAAVAATGAVLAAASGTATPTEGFIAMPPPNGAIPLPPAATTAAHDSNTQSSPNNAPKKSGKVGTCTNIRQKLTKTV